MNRRRSFVLSTALAGLLGLSIIPSFAAQDQELYARGRDAVFAERWDDARKVLEDLIRRHPGSPHADDAHYWLGMALYESKEPDRAYGVLKQLQTRYPDSPWNDDGRALMVRCAEAALLASARPGQAPRLPASPTGGQEPSRLAEYESFLRQSTLDSNSKVQLLAIDTVLGSRPEMAPELLPRLSAGSASREAAGLVVDRFFGDARVKVLMERPSLGFTEGNVVVMLRSGDTVSQLTLVEALEEIDSGGRSPRRLDSATVSELRERLVQAERGLIEAGGPGTIESSADGTSMSAIVKVVDGEVHYYRNDTETTRIVVLKRQAGFHASNVRVFVENRSGIRELPLEGARGLTSGGSLGVSDQTVRYLRAALAIIEIDLNRTAGAPAGGTE